MSQLEDMRLLVDTLDAGSFTAAAERLGLSKQFVSKRLMALEARLGVRLLNRTTRRLSATGAGLAFSERARNILQDVDSAEQLISQQNNIPRGSLRLSAPMSFGTMHLSPAIPRFLQAHAEVSIELDLNDRTVDLIGEGYDMAVRIGVLADSTLIGRNIAPMEVVTCASPAYLARKGIPRTPADLAQHDCLLYGHARHVEWLFTQHSKPYSIAVTGRLRANNGEVSRDAAIDDLGLVHLPTFIVGEAVRTGRLITVLNEFRPPLSAIHAVYPQHRQSSLAIHAFVDFLRSSFASPIHDSLPMHVNAALQGS